jgi:hypothetical protein
VTGLRLDFTLRPRQFVDLDTLTETALGGLRDAGLHARGFPDLDVVLATLRREGAPGLDITTAEAAPLRQAVPPGPAALDVAAEHVPPATAAGKRAWRQRIAAAWSAPPLLTELVWADVALAVPGSILGPLEVVLDALEPVLGRDPRGRDRQEFFPGDDRIVWLRVRRESRRGAPPLRLRLGPARAG